MQKNEVWLNLDKQKNKILHNVDNQKTEILYNKFDGQKNLIFQSETFFSAYNSNGGMTVAQAATVLNWNPKHLDIKTRSVQPYQDY